ncbi:signal transduction histidine kinase [Haloferula luteola]|uniref:histidine kinase n=1 Tax=Haloferula luteola TaxID=595692 RepID=A0A840V976_9BACT|nr:ATP-binding protein [Haloferula luteola]MBB5352144.1 signal transduction histidine kinase [Haloferula luteola]
MVLEWQRPQACEVMADAAAVERILVNLLSNAEKYAGEGATVVVTVRERGGRGEVEVVDNGPGVPRGQARRIFKPFARGGCSTTEGVSGTGLGLSISRSLAGRMGGTLEWVEVASGACFRLQLPAAERRVG